MDAPTHGQAFDALDRQQAIGLQASAEAGTAAHGQEALGGHGHTNSKAAAATHGQSFGNQDQWAVTETFWILVLGVIIGVWLLRSRLTGGSHGGRHEKGRAAQPDPEELRKKRLEALQKVGCGMPAADQASPRTNRDAAATSQSVSRAPEGLRQRIAPVDKDHQETKKDPDSGVVAGNTAQSCTSTEQVVLEGGHQPDTLNEGNGSAAFASSADTSTMTTSDEAITARQSSAGPVLTAAKPLQTELLESGYSVQFRGRLRDTVATHTLEGLTRTHKVQEVQERVAAAFGVASDTRCRLFFNGKELKKPDVLLGEVGILAGSLVQVMFITAATSTAVPPQSADAARTKPSTVTAAVPTSGRAVASTASAESAPNGGEGQLKTHSVAESGGCRKAQTHDGQDFGSQPCALRVQGGSASHEISGLTRASTVVDLEAHVARVFKIDEATRMRLFYMGKELKDPDEMLGAVGIQDGVTIQAMFSAGKPRPRPVGEPLAHGVPITGDAASAANRVLAATGSAGDQQADTETASTILAAAEAAGLNTSAFRNGGEIAGIQSSIGDAGAPSSGQTSSPSSPEEAWRALALLENQLARASDESEAPGVRQASAILRQMLATVTHTSNPALLQFAQASVPDLSKIWSYEPTRERLCLLLSSNAQGTAGGTSNTAGQQLNSAG